MDMNTMNINRKMSETLKKLAEIQARTAPIRLRIGTVKNGTVYHTASKWKTHRLRRWSSCTMRAMR